MVSDISSSPASLSASQSASSSANETPRTALITGCSRGIGLQIKALFESRGARVFAPTRQELDLSDRKSVQTYLTQLSKTLSLKGERVDILINNAGENPIRTLTEIDLATWDRIQQINLTSPLMLMQHLAPRMAELGFGRIVNISSIYSAKARTGRGIYSATKAGLDALTRTFAVEYSKSGVLVNSICPGFIDTELTRKNNSQEVIQKLLERVPVGNLGATTDVAELAWFLCSKQNNFISGQCIQIDGAFSVS